jgi:hypothetical protein
VIRLKTFYIFLLGLIKSKEELRREFEGGDRTLPVINFKRLCGLTGE